MTTYRLGKEEGAESALLRRGKDLWRTAIGKTEEDPVCKNKTKKD